MTLAQAVYFFILCVGGLTGWGFGKLMNKLLHETRRTVIPDIVLGIGGFIAGMWAAFIDSSLYQESYNGVVTVRRVTGYGEYWLLIAIAGAIILVFALHLALTVSNKFCWKRRNPV